MSHCSIFFISSIAVLIIFLTFTENRVEAKALPKDPQSNQTGSSLKAVLSDKNSKKEVSFEAPKFNN